MLLLLFSAQHSRGTGGVSPAMVSLLVPPLFVSLGADCCPSSISWAAKHEVLPWKSSSMWITVLMRELEAGGHLPLSSLPLLGVTCHE